MANKIVFITGATSGFGEACAHKFAAAGYNIIINGRRLDRLKKLQQQLTTQYSVEIFTAPFDVQNQQAVFATIESLPEQWRQVDVLINNAGLALGRDLFD